MSRALSNGLNEMLVCLASFPLQVGEADGDVVWHEDAEFWPVGDEPSVMAEREPPDKQLRSA